MLVDYVTVQGNIYIASGGVSVNLHNGDAFGQWSFGRAYPAPYLKPGVTLVTGTIIGGRGATDTSEFLRGASAQVGGFYPAPVVPLIGVGGGLNHSYGGRTAVETSISMPPGYQVSPVGYGFDWNIGKQK